MTLFLVPAKSKILFHMLLVLVGKKLAIFWGTARPLFCLDLSRSSKQFWIHISDTRMVENTWFVTWTSYIIQLKCIFLYLCCKATYGRLLYHTIVIRVYYFHFKSRQSAFYEIYFLYEVCHRKEAFSQENLVKRSF